ncbi:MAG: PIG-L family deacetylase [Candidatus Stahlbacteria bacterium]|nr:PIG-L family deacetylase [Candidatus Stahlbacteria bacterium]
MKILAIGAHPDDIEYGCGGTLLKYKNSGHKLYLLILTGGEKSGGSIIRQNEQNNAARFIGVKKIIWGGFRDTELVANRELISKIDSVMSKIQPDEVYVNYPDDAHQDHRACAECTITACRYQKRVLLYEDYTTRNFEPNVFVDIGDVLVEKAKLLGLHQSQVSKSYPTGLDMLESVKSIASFRGFQGKVKYAEGFVALRYMVEI